MLQAIKKIRDEAINFQALFILASKLPGYRVIFMVVTIERKYNGQVTYSPPFIVTFTF